jgi:hypothetical protein
MAKLKIATVAVIVALSIAAAVVGLQFETTRALAGPPQQGPTTSSGFMGAWCAQGDPTKQCSVSGNGVFLTFTNETGSTSSGHFVGMAQNIVSADEWNFVQGTLSGDGGTINWSNGTYWARCPGSGGGGGGHRTPNLDGTWYRGGDRSQRCSIRQRRRNLQLRNESGQTATGSIDGRGRVSTNWSGTQINGTISPDGNTIHWNNGTSWSR